MKEISLRAVLRDGIYIFLDENSGKEISLEDALEFEAINIKVIKKENNLEEK